MRVVLDTNVFVAGLIARGPAAKVLNLWFDQRFLVLTSEAQIGELRKVLRSKFSDVVPAQTRAKLIARIRRAAIVVNPKRTPPLSPDPDDNLILAIALEGQADMLVTGDKGHLLSLKVRGLHIATVRQFLAMV